jgi:hypothetical protein
MSRVLLRNHGDQRILAAHETVAAQVIAAAARRVMPMPGSSSARSRPSIRVKADRR